MTTGPDGITEFYRTLYAYLMSAPASHVVLRFDEIESVLGFGLVERAQQDPMWWSATPRNSWARSWLRANRLATLDPEGRTVTFSPGSVATSEDLEALVAQRRREDNYASEALWRGPIDTEIRDRWWEPHLVYVIHVHAERLYKVGLTRHDTRRLRELTARGRADIVCTVLVANRWAAKLVEVAVLDETDTARRAADRFNYHNGQTEHWDDSTAPPALEPIVEGLSSDGRLRYWLLSESRRGEDFERN